jgi:hypothetical protein
MLDIVDGKALLRVLFEDTPSSITILALAKRFKMKLEAAQDKEVSYRIDVTRAVSTLEAINSEKGKQARLAKSF